MNRMIKNLLAVIVISPILAWGGEEMSQRVRQKYGLPIHQDQTSTPSKIAGIGIHAGDVSSKVVYAYQLDSDYEIAKADLKRKGVNFIEADNSHLADDQSEVPLPMDPRKIADYRVSLGEDEEGWQVILFSHQFDGSQKKWIKQTTVRIIIPSEPAVQKPVPPSTPETPPKVQTPEPSLQPTKPTPAPAKKPTASPVREVSPKPKSKWKHK